MTKPGGPDYHTNERVLNRRVYNDVVEWSKGAHSTYIGKVYGEGAPLFKIEKLFFKTHDGRPYAIWELCVWRPIRGWVTLDERQNFDSLKLIAEIMVIR